MARIKTPFTDLLGIGTPIVCCPMAMAGGGQLAGAVSAAGGLGFIGAGYMTPSQLSEQLSLASSHVPVAPSTRLPIGVGFLVWILSSLPDQDSAALIDVVLRARPMAIWLAFGDDIVHWSQLVRKRDEELNGGEDRVKLFVLVGNEEEARKAVVECRADVLAVQSAEAGGHGSSSAPPLLSILPALTRLLPELTKEPPPVIATGGLAVGSHLAAMLSLGASGMGLGTRFLATPQALYTAEQKNLLLESTSTDTVRTMAFDHARGTIGWPEGVDGRGIRNLTVEEYAADTLDMDKLRSSYKAAAEKKDLRRIVTWAGTGVGLVKEIKDAGEIVHEVTRDAIASLSASSQYLRR